MLWASPALSCTAMWTSRPGSEAPSCRHAHQDSLNTPAHTLRSCCTKTARVLSGPAPQEIISHRCSPMRTPKWL